ncbi:MAG: TadE family protein [Nitriliruptorales bacterium]|nr:TadE family protein [Nitriliruptorales bacterium]
MPDRLRNRGRVDSRCGRHDTASITFEAVLVLPVVMLAAFAVLEVVGVVRDALLVHEAARAGVRAAITSTGTDAVEIAVESVLAGREHVLEVTPTNRVAGQLVTVKVRAPTRLGPIDHWVEATLVAEVEPVVGS